MAQFVGTVLAYFSGEVLGGAWAALQAAVARPAGGVEGLCRAHDAFLQTVLARCLLTSNAAAVLDLLDGCLQLALAFAAQLSAAPRFWDLDTAAAGLAATHARFHQYAVYLCSVAGKLADGGFHDAQLAAFVLRVNFNGFYSPAPAPAPVATAAVA
jgi:hypothetical protein